MVSISTYVLEVVIILLKMQKLAVNNKMIGLLGDLIYFMQILCAFLIIGCDPSNNFTSLPTDALINIIHYLPCRQQYNVLSLHSKLDAAIRNIRNDEIIQMQHLMSYIKIATVNDMLFNKYKQCIKNELITNQNNVLIDELPRILSLLRRSNISDANKLEFLEYIGMYSSSSSGPVSLIYFYPELWLNYQSYAYYHGPSISFNELPRMNRILVMSSRVISQAIYPFVSEINSLRNYVCEYLSHRAPTRIIYSLYQNLQQYGNLPTTSILYQMMSTKDPLGYFAALYFEELIDNFVDSLDDANNIIFDTNHTQMIYAGMKNYNFIEWNPPIIRMIKRQYFEAWKTDLNLQKRHRYHLLTYHELYSQMLDLPNIFELFYFNPLRIKISTIALLETFDACLSDTSCNISNHDEYLSKETILMHGLDNYYHEQIELCRKLMHRFLKICDKNDLLWIIKWKHPYSYSVYHLLMGYSGIEFVSEFKLFCICYLYELRQDWVLWKLRLHAAFCQIDYQIIQGLKANKII